jgi:MerR family transcriptional regulator, thiopeptide resistance regulator
VIGTLALDPHEIGLLSPGGRSSAAYRLYEDADVDRLQQILFYRELGFPLDQIATILNDPDAHAGEHLNRQRSLLLERIGRLEALVATIDRTKEARRMGTRLTPEEKLEIFGEWSPPDG